MSITSTAPGKIILFGEHSVVYNRPAIAAPIHNVQARADIQPTESGTGFIINAPDLGQRNTLADLADDNALAWIVRLTLSHLQQTPPDAMLTVSSTIPLGRGLGSGAAISAAIVQALAEFFQSPLPPLAVSDLVYEVEKLYHGTPSGIDNTVIAYCQPVYFIRNQPIERLQVNLPLTFVIADTGVVAPTHKIVGRVRERWQANPEFYEQQFDEIERIVIQAREMIEQGTDDLTTFGELMRRNQERLQMIGVSSPELERLIETANNAGALGAKLSGAGGGGNMIALATEETAEDVASALLAAGATGVIMSGIYQMI